VWYDDTLSASQPIVDVARQLVFAADQVRRRWVVLVQFARRGVVRTTGHDLAHVFRSHVNGHGPDHTAVQRTRPGGTRARAGAWSGPTRRCIGAEPNGTRAAHANVQLPQPIRVLLTRFNG